MKTEDTLLTDIVSLKLKDKAFTIYRHRDPESSKLHPHFTVVNEDEDPRRGYTSNSLEVAISEAFPS